MTMSNHMRTRAARDRGLTLVEVVISAAIMGMLSVLVVGAITVVFRSQAGITNTTASSHDLQQAVNFFYRDVQSGPIELAAYRVTGGAEPTGSGCDDAGDANVLRFDTNERRVAYRLESDGSNAELDRIVCTFDGSSWVEESDVNIADALDAADGSPVSVDLVASSADPTEVDRVVLSFAALVGGDEEISAAPRAQAAAEVPTSTAVECDNDVLSATEGFQTFVQGDLHLDGSQVKQSLAVGGALSFEGNVTVGQNMNQASDYPTASGLEDAALIVGSIDWDNSASNATLTVHSGADAAFGDFSDSEIAAQGQNLLVYQSGDSNRSPQVRIQNGGSVLTDSDAIDFDAAFDSLRSCSVLLAGLPGDCSCSGHVELTNVNGDPYEGTSENSSVKLVLTDGIANSFNLDESNLADLTDIKWDSVFPSSTAPLIITVATGADATFTPPQIQGGGSTASSIIWNFPNVTGTLDISGGGGDGVWGTVMAPFGHVDSLVKVEGGIIAKSFTFSGSSVNPSRSFDGTVTWND